VDGKIALLLLKPTQWAPVMADADLLARIPADTLDIDATLRWLQLARSLPESYNIEKQYTAESIVAQLEAPAAGRGYGGHQKLFSLTVSLLLYTDLQCVGGENGLFPMDWECHDPPSVQKGRTCGHIIRITKIDFSVTFHACRLQWIHDLQNKSILQTVGHGHLEVSWNNSAIDKKTLVKRKR
jgi:hypothetical protein